MPNHMLSGVRNMGLGAILKEYRLTVPPNQRDYSWTEDEVSMLFKDFARAINDVDSDYFLGTVVAIDKGRDNYEIVDGQQRLATTTILLTAIRNYLLSVGESEIAGSVESDFLVTSSRASRREREARLRLNLADNDFFQKMITSVKPDFEGIEKRESHELIRTAYQLAERHVSAVVAPHDKKTHGDVLEKWLEFIQHSAQVIFLAISSESNAYRMFETLNDRGLKVTQADLVKNYLFGRAGDERVGEAQDKWSLMRGSLETLDENQAPTIMYLRHALMLKKGYFREGDLHDVVSEYAKSPSTVLGLLGVFETLSADYVALFNPDNERWNSHPETMREALRTLNQIGIAGIRPLMLAIASKFDKREAAAALTKIIAWNVRFLISGSTLTGGYVEVPLANAAKEVFEGSIATAKALSGVMASRVPQDEQFEKAFSEATVSKASLARYYLRSLERVAKAEPDPWFTLNSDAESINLEHILPRKPLGNWPEFSSLEAKADQKRIGNMALMPTKQNSDAKSVGFTAKKHLYKGPYVLTSQIAELSTWNHAAVVQRQALLAKFALKAWPL